MFKTSMVRTLLAGVSILSLCAAHSHAQSVDYGALQQMFGEPITTSVTGTPQRASEAPAAMSIVTQDDIRQSGADNLPDILQFVTGIDIRTYSFGQSEIAIRGYDQPYYPRMLVLVNGRQVYLDDYGYVDWNSIPVQLSEIRQIEVVKGPASALFGFNAAAGVINIITYDPLLDSTNTATVRGGTQSLGQGEAVTTVHLGKTFGGRISVGGFTSHDYSRPAGQNFPKPRSGKLNADFRWQVTPKIQLRAEAGISSDNYTESSSLGVLSIANNRTNDVRVGVAAETPFGLVDLDAYRNEARQQYTPLGLQLTGTNVVRVVKLNDLLKIGSSNIVRISLEYRNNLETSDSLTNGTVSYDDYAAGAMWNINLSPKLSMVNAVRMDYAVLNSDATVFPVAGNSQDLYNKTTITAPSFNSGLVYAMTPDDTVRLTAARGLQMPSLFDLGLQAQLGPELIAGTPTLSPIATWNIDLGYDRSLAPINSNLTLDGFLQRNTDLIDGGGAGLVLPIPGGIAITTINAGSSNEAGIEIGIKGKSPIGLRWNASYQYYTISQDITSVVGPSTSTSLARGTPTSEIILGAGYSIGRWEFDLKSRWQSEYRDYYLSATGGALLEVGNYVTMAARIGYNITPHITLAGYAQQFNLARVRETAGLLVDRRFIASATIHY